MRDALWSAYTGRLFAPPRMRAHLGDLGYVFTVGGVEGDVSGFRAYRVGRPAGDQLVAVWSNDGHVRGIVIGVELGARRTGALGAVAADLLALPEAETAGVIGSGTQAWTQLWALCAVRSLRSVRVFSRDPTRRAAFADAASRELGVDTRAVTSSRDAVHGADVVILATRSDTPVIDAADVAPGAHVTTVGPKRIDAHETPLALVDAAAVVSCDSPSQAASYPAQFFIGDRQLVDLGAVLAGAASGRRSPDDITLHCSVGLAGSEVVLAERLFAERSAT